MMPRKRRNKENAEATKKRVRSFRNRERRTARNHDVNEPDDLSWITRSKIRMTAARILNDNGRDRPFWLSMPHEYDGVSPVAIYHPCNSFKTKTRIYYGFMFREHRDAFFLKVRNARKELTGPNGPLR